MSLTMPIKPLSKHLDLEKFSAADHIIIICSQFGTNIEETFKSFETEANPRFSDKNYLYISTNIIAATQISLYADTHNIETTLFLIDASPSFRVKNVLKHLVNSNKILIDKYNINPETLYLHVNNELEATIMTDTEDGYEINNDPLFLELVDNAKILCSNQKSINEDYEKLKNILKNKTIHVNVSNQDKNRTKSIIWNYVRTPTKAIMQEKQFTPPIGDIMPFSNKNIICECPQIDRKLFVNNIISMFNGNPFDALDSIGIDTSDFKEKYTCPYSGIEFYSLIPYYLISNDLSVYIRKEGNPFYDMNMDKEWQWDMIDEEEPFEPSRLIKSMIGSGYTDFCNLNDGHGDYIIVGIELENGDKLVCLTWEWFNK